MQYKKIGWLKELGRAAYANPIKRWGGLEKEDIKRFESSAQAQKSATGIESIRSCPVCGCKTMMVYRDEDCEYDDPEEGTISAAWEFTWRASCICCTFEVTKELGNPSEHGLANIQDLWYSRNL